MKKYLVLVFAAVALLICMLPESAFAADIKIQTKPGEKYIIRDTLYVKPGDSLEITAGSEIEILAGAYIYVQGNLFIGTNSNLDGPAKSVKVKVFGYNTAFQINGGRMIAAGMDFTGRKFIDAYNGARVDISSSELHDFNSNLTNHTSLPAFISIYNHSSFELTHSLIDSLNTTPTSSISLSELPRSSLIETYSYSSTTLEYVSIHSDISRVVSQTYLQSKTHLEKTQIHNCDQWFVVYSNSSLSGSVNKADCSVLAPGVFNNSTNTITYDYKPCCSSILFMPGLQGSRLYHKKRLENQLWEPNREADVKSLFLDEWGKSVLSNIYTRDIIEKTNILGPVATKSVYESFVHFLKGMVADKLIKEYAIFPYDWRFSADDIVNENKLIPLIESLAKKSENGKVTLVAHSYGGLVAKSLMTKLDMAGKGQLIDHIVLVGTPEAGAPKALFTLLQGYGQGSFTDFIMNSNTLMNFAKNMPAAYALLPSKVYAKNTALFFKSKNDEFFSEHVLPKPNKVQDAIDWLDIKMKDIPNGEVFIDPNIANSEISRVNILSKANNILQQKAMNLHEKYQITDFSQWQHPRAWSISGTNIQTASGMHYVYSKCEKIVCTGRITLTAWPFYSTDGDGTVILDSFANRIGTTTRIDLSALNIARKTNINHVRMLESTDIQKIIRQIIVSGFVASTEPFVVDEGNMQKYDRSFQRMIIEGKVVGGIQVEYDGKRYATEILKNGESFQIIEDVPNSSLDAQNGFIEITSASPAPHLAFSSLENQRINIEIESVKSDASGDFYGTVSGNTVDHPNVSAGTYYRFENISAPRNANITFNQEESTIVVDTNKDGVGDRIYRPIDTTLPHTPTSTPTEITVLSLADDIDILMNHIGLKADALNGLFVYPLRKTYARKLIKLNNHLRIVQMRLNKLGNTNLQFTKAELKTLRQDIVVFSDAYRRLKELEHAYDKIVIQAEMTIAKGGTIRAINKAIVKKANAELYLSDLSKIFEVYSGLEDEILEFYARQ